MGYDIKSGRKLLKTDTLMNFTRNGVNRVGYKRKKKTKKTQQTQYAEDDNHHVQSNETHNSRINNSVHDGSTISGNSATLSGSIPYLCFTTIVQCNDLTYLKEYSVRQNILQKEYWF